MVKYIKKFCIYLSIVAVGVYVIVCVFFPGMIYLPKYVAYKTYEQFCSYPHNSIFNGSVYGVKKYLQDHLQDANSVQYVEWGSVYKKDNGNYEVYCKYRAKNGFGAYILACENFTLSEENIVIDLEENYIPHRYIEDLDKISKDNK